MFNIISKTLSLLLLLLSTLLANDFIQLKKNITSLLNTTNLIEFNNNLIVGTDGGLYVYDYIDNYSTSENLYSSSISSLNICPQGYLWVGSQSSGDIMIFDNQFNLFENIEYPQFDKVYKIDFSDNAAFAIVSIDQEMMLAHYNTEDISDPYYLNLYSSFPISFEKINSLVIVDNMIYLATTEGLLSADYNDMLSFSSSWNISYEMNDITSILEYNNQLIISYSNNIVNIDDDLTYTIEDIETIENIYLSDNINEIIISDDKDIFSFDFSGPQLIIHEFPNDIYNDKTAFINIDDKKYYGLENRGILINDVNVNSWISYIPNTIFSNQFDALALSTKNDLIGVVNHKDNNGQSGGFIYKNPLKISTNLNSINNFYSYNGFHINNFPTSISEFKASIVDYWSGDNTIKSAVVDNQNNLYFSNSGTYPPAWLGHYENVANNYSFALSDQTAYGGVLEIQINLSDLSFEISNVYNLANNVLGGNNGIFNSSWTDGFMTINQIIKDVNDNIWVVNPYSEHNNNPIAIKNLNQWFHIHYDNEDGYIPQEIAFDNNNNVWISYKFSDTIDNVDEYSSGGIKMVEINQLQDEGDDVWHTSWLDHLDGENIWTITMSKDHYGNQILWVMTDLGILGYLVDIDYTHSGNIITDFVQLSDDYFFQGLSYQEGCKLRIDNQNNVWITTKTDGLRVIQSNGQLLDNNMGIVNVNEYGILSNNIYDVIFDDFGYVYIATEMGVSILETSFNKNLSSENVSVSPNPFIIGESNQIIISNVSENSIVKIMNLSGYVVKEFDMKYTGKYIDWTGKSDEGYNLGTGIYLLSVFNDNHGLGTTKLAIINK